MILISPTFLLEQPTRRRGLFYECSQTPVLLMLLPLAGKLAQVNRGKFTWILHKNYAGSAELERKAQIDRTCLVCWENESDAAVQSRGIFIVLRNCGVSAAAPLKLAAIESEQFAACSIDPYKFRGRHGAIQYQGCTRLSASHLCAVH